MEEGLGEGPIRGREKEGSAALGEEPDRKPWCWWNWVLGRILILWEMAELEVPAVQETAILRQEAKALPAT